MDNQTLELREKIEIVNKTIDDFVTAIAVNDSDKKDKLYQMFLIQIQEIFSMIIQYYTRPDMQSLQHELQEWSGCPNDLQRIKITGFLGGILLEYSR